MNTEAHRTLMVVGAHHDDNELLAGTIARHRETGWRVVSVVMTNGRWAQGVSSDATIAVRNNESRRAAELLDMELVFMELDEAALQASEANCLALLRVMRQHRPAVVVTHPPLDYHSDHMATSQCVLDATHRCSLPIDCGASPCPVPQLYYCDAWFVPFTPDVYIDVSAWIERKAQALRCHASQLPPEGSDSDNMIEMALVRDRFRGVESGCRYAEAFRLAPQFQRVRTAELLQ